MRDLTKALFCSVLLIASTQASEKSCKERGLELKTKVFQISRKGVKKKLLVSFPSSLSIHSGQFEEFVVKGKGKLSHVNFEYAGKHHKEIKKLKFSKAKNLNLTKNTIKSFINRWVVDSPGMLSVKLFKNKKVVCTEKIKVVAGD